MPEKRYFGWTILYSKDALNRNLAFGKEQQKRRRKTSGIRHPENEGRN